MSSCVFVNFLDREWKTGSNKCVIIIIDTSGFLWGLHLAIQHYVHCLGDCLSDPPLSVHITGVDAQVVQHTGMYQQDKLQRTAINTRDTAIITRKSNILKCHKHTGF